MYATAPSPLLDAAPGAILCEGPGYRVVSLGVTALDEVMYDVSIQSSEVGASAWLHAPDGEAFVLRPCGVAPGLFVGERFWGGGLLRNGFGEVLVVCWLGDVVEQAAPARL